MFDWVLNMPLLPITETELNQSSSITESCKTPIKKTRFGEHKVNGRNRPTLSRSMRLNL